MFTNTISDDLSCLVKSEACTRPGIYSKDGKTFTFRGEKYCIDDLKNLPIPDYDVDSVAYMIITNFFGIFTELALRANKEDCEDILADEYRFSQMVHDSHVWEQAVEDAIQEVLPESDAKIMNKWYVTILAFINAENYSAFAPFYEKVYDRLAHRVDELTKNMLTILAKARLLQLKDEK